MTPAQRKLATAARACKGQGRIGTARRTACIVEHLGSDGPAYSRRRRRKRR